ncbi:prostaglandin-endoperoxide synthase 2 [Jatrophihabitans sp. GAS493]|uniref:peroxidase family protein n=1 Tax=Jatrophihabitans sp. GAS493 TaxID=1907575 RepID=UPI000BB7D40B|nr:peroxidase family protein [Jatrophihabitans sp. GAS493]SOD74571.1 prostaglandin-endoperoxide synthase 2 [Jatrophihabitans sp. GAS493]
MFPQLPKSINHLIPKLVGPLRDVPAVRGLLSGLIINEFSYSTTLRPRPLSLMSDYTSWESLTDRSYSGRHLPPASDETMAALPPLADVVALFRRDEEIKSTDTSVMFMFFAQWFVDSFLATDMVDFRRNHSNHEIDLCEIYGLSPSQTDLLRAHEGGRLKSQLIDGEEYPQFYFQPRDPGAALAVKPEFIGLFDENFVLNVILGDAPDDRKDSFFAVGLAHGNSTIGNTIMNIVWLREHNRLAGLLAAEYPEWDDERVFQTARNVTIVLLLKIVVEEYIKHIGPWDVPVEMVNLIADGERWNRTNWAAVEFNILYRWHMLVPDAIGSGPDEIGPDAVRNNNPLVISEGIEALMRHCSNVLAGKIGLFNTPTFLVDRHGDSPSIEERTVQLGRQARLRSYNEYRVAYGYKAMSSYSELTHDKVVQQRLEALYGDIDNLEWYVGIFAEGYPDYMMMGELLTSMVANDAFTQALTNPLLARHVYSPQTFSPLGLKTIEETTSLQQIVKRNSRDPDSVYVSFSCSGK